MYMYTNTICRIHIVLLRTIAMKKKNAVSKNRQNGMT